VWRGSELHEIVPGVVGEVENRFFKYKAACLDEDRIIMHLVLGARLYLFREGSARAYGVVERRHFVEAAGGVRKMPPGLAGVRRRARSSGFQLPFDGATTVGAYREERKVFVLLEVAVRGVRCHFVVDARESRLERGQVWEEGEVESEVDLEADAEAEVIEECLVRIIRELVSEEVDVEARPRRVSQSKGA